MSKPLSFLHVLAALALVAASASALAQSFPAKPIRLVIPNAPGGIDTYARVMLPRLSEDLGQPIVTENHAGASGIIGSDLVAKAPADGHTLLMGTSAILVTVPFLNRNVPFDVLKDFTPVSQLLGIVSTLAINPALPVKNVAELVEYAKKNPGKLTYGSTGVGTLPHLNGEIPKVTAGIDLLHVPFKGTAQLATELQAGRIDIDLTGLGAIRTQVAAGKLRLIALLGAARFAPAGDVPSINETFPTYRDAPSWVAIVAPAGLPRPVLDRLNGAIQKTMALPEVRANYDKLGLRVIASSPEELGAAMRSGAEQVGALVKRIGIKPE